MEEVQMDAAFITAYLFPQVGILDVSDNFAVAHVIEDLTSSLSVYQKHDFTVLQVLLQIHQMWERFMSFRLFVEQLGIQYCEETNSVMASPEYFFRVRPDAESARWKSFREGGLCDMATKRHIFTEGGFAGWNFKWLVNYAS